MDVKVDDKSKKPYEGLTALIADSNPVIFSAIRSSLSDLGFTVLEGINDLQKLRQAVSDANPDLLVCDLQLSGGSVAAFASDLRRGQLGARPYLCMIATTWTPDEESVRRALRAGFDDVLMKPIRMQRLLRHIRHLAEDSRQFVVTAGYVGPDRRKHDGADGTRHLHNVYRAPNSLTPGQNDDEVAKALIEAIRAVARPHWRDRLLPILHPVLEALENLTQDMATHSPDSDQAATIGALGQNVERLEAAVETHDDHHVSELVRAISDGVDGLGDEPGSETGPETEAERQMLRDLVTAIRHILAREQDASSSDASDDAGR